MGTIFAALIGVIVGFVLGIPPGPIGMTTIKMSAFNPKKNSYHLITATSMMDFIYILLTFFMTAAIIESLKNFTTKYTVITKIIQLSVVLVFIAFGIYNLIQKKTNPEKELQEKSEPKIGFLEKLGQRGPFFLGIALSLSNLVNPSFLPSLGFVTLQIAAWHLFPLNIENKIFFSVGFGLGTFLWLYTLTNIISANKHRMSE
ncbi:MAG TPA: LysE family transporter, partial [Candidatus Kapabacteria bacterium]|nr:LysE family transporter [Candidatus Kapabacteria bacterium]